MNLRMKKRLEGTPQQNRALAVQALAMAILKRNRETAAK